jgi:hypothetical protein
MGVIALRLRISISEQATQFYNGRTRHRRPHAFSGVVSSELLAARSIFPTVRDCDVALAHGREYPSASKQLKLTMIFMARGTQLRELYGTGD